MLFLLTAVIGVFIPKEAKIAVILSVAFVFVSITAILLCKRAKPYSILCVALSASMIVISMVSSYVFFSKREHLKNYCETECTIEALVISERYSTANLDGYQILVNKLNGEKISHKAVLDCMYGSVLEPGDTFTAKVTAEQFDAVSGSYNEELSMLADNIFLSYTSNSSDTLLITDEDVFHISILFSKANAAVSRVFTANLDTESGELSSALLLGNKDILSDTVKRDFSRSGVSHILALSGLHMSVIMGAILLCLRKLNFDPKLSAVILMGCSVFYLFLTGCSVSAARSVIMLDFVYLATLVGRRADSLTSLSLAGFILTLISPGTVVDAGFWMSFSATLGLLVYMPSFNTFTNQVERSFNRYKIIVKPLKAFATALAASIFALIPLIAVMCVFIKELSLYSIWSSAILALPTQLLLILSLLFLPFAKIPYLSALLATAITRISEFMISFCGDISDRQGVVLSLNYPFAALAAVILVVALAYSLIYKSKNIFRALAPFAAALCVFFIAISVYSADETDTVKLSYINASSQSDITVLSNDGEAVICDIGNGSKTSYQKALGELHEARVTEIKAILLTRYSHKHNSALAYVFANEKVRQIWVPYPENTDEYHLLVPLKQIAEQYGVEVRVYENDSDFKVFDTVRISVYRDRLSRSNVPVSVISFNSRSERIMYLSPAFNELEIPEHISMMMEKTEFFIFGNRGPVTKTEYTIPTDNDAELVVFADNIRAAYFNNEGIFNTTLLLAPEKCNIYIKK